MHVCQTLRNTYRCVCFGRRVLTGPCHWVNRCSVGGEIICLLWESSPLYTLFLKRGCCPSLYDVVRATPHLAARTLLKPMIGFDCCVARLVTSGAGFNYQKVLTSSFSISKRDPSESSQHQLNFHIFGFMSVHNKSNIFRFFISCFEYSAGDFTDRHLVTCIEWYF